MSRAAALSAPARRAASIRGLLELARDHDPRQISTAAVAAATGVSHAALFRHYTDKAALWMDAVEWIELELLARMDAAAEQAKDPAQALQAMFLAHARFLGDHPGAPRLLLSELQSAGDSSAKARAAVLVGRYSERLLKRVHAARRRGELHPGHPPKLVVSLLLGALQGLVVQSMLSGHPEQIPKQAPALFDALWIGLGAPR